MLYHVVKKLHLAMEMAKETMEIVSHNDDSFGIKHMIFS